MLTSLQKNGIYRLVNTILWFLVLVGLPLTSFPILNRLTGAIVAPFSFIPLAILIIIYLIPVLLRGRRLPAEMVPYFYFIGVAIGVSALAVFMNGMFTLNRDFLSESLRGFITVAIGLAFYIIFSTYPRDASTFRQTLCFIYIGGALLIGWTFFEVYLLRTHGSVRDMPDWFLKFRSLLAKQSPNILYTNRVTGFAYEPSWFARQFNLVLFPLWMSSVFQRLSLFKFRLWLFQIEDFLFMGGLIAFGFGSPRVGLLAFMLSVAYLAYLFLRKGHHSLTNWVVNRRKNPPRRLFWTRLLLAILMVVTLTGIAAAALTGYVVIASRWDDRYELLLEDARLSRLKIFPLTEDSIIDFSEELAFFERTLYWFGGWRIFNEHPFGVGLGNAGFYFYDQMNDKGYKSPEIRDLFYRANTIPNTKSIWVRLLAETGFIGLSIFLIWLYIMWRSSGLMLLSRSELLRIIGLGGRLFLLAYLIEGFSLDSFAMPYQWLMAGLIAAGGWLARQDLQPKDKLAESVSVRR